MCTLNIGTEVFYKKKKIASPVEECLIFLVLPSMTEIVQVKLLCCSSVERVKLLLMLLLSFLDEPHWH